ncbi:MAG: polysaccharide biosynthesis protein [Gammaproteobacteria bacterium]
MLNAILSLPRNAKRLLLAGFDVFALSLSVWLAFMLRFESNWLMYLQDRLWLFPLVVAVSIPVFWQLGFYRSVIRYMNAGAYWALAQGISLSLLICIAVWVFAAGIFMPRSIWVNFWIVAFLLISGSRFLVRAVSTDRRQRLRKGERVAIYGAGDAGVQLAMALQQSHEFHPTLFLDDSIELQGNEILGLPVRSPRELEALVPRLRIATVLLAIPSISAARKRDVIGMLEKLPVHVMVMPGVAEIARGVKRVDDLREVDVEDILGRDPVEPNEHLMNANIRGKSVMVTGAGGSIGSELCRQIISQEPQRLIVVDMCEYALYTIERELQRIVEAVDSDAELTSLLCSVCDRERLQSVMSTFKVHTVYHAAAYKHVPMVEHNPLDGVKNNILGTCQAALAAIDSGAEMFVLVSTDKAVRPTSVMGATKRFAELILQALSGKSTGTRFCMVRFGNVLASSGSVVPLFREQIRKGGPITVTHPDVVRYFMTIPEAAQLVIQAGAEAQGGDVFVLDMGEPIRIVELARRMIRLYGFEVRDEENPDGDIEIHFTGLRPGEKLFEELLIGVSDLPTGHPKIMRAQEETLPLKQVESYLRQFEKAIEELDYVQIRSLLLKAVQGYKPENGIEDVVWVEQDKPAASESASRALH